MQKHVGQFIGRPRDPVHAFHGINGWSGRRHRGHFAHESEHGVGQSPSFAHTLSHGLVGDAQHSFGGRFLVRVLRPGHGLAHLLCFIGQVELGQQAPEVLKQRANENLFAFAQLGGAQIGRKRRRQQRTHKLAFELVGMGLVFHVVQQHQAHGHVADACEPDQTHCP